VRYRLGTPGFRTREITRVTTLLDAAAYGVSDRAERYRQRWQVETSRAQLKTTMQMDVLHGKTVPGVLKELTRLAIVYNLVRLVMRQAATLQHTAVERISFLEALRWLSAPRTGMPLVAWMVIPVRPHRVEPRVKKRRPKSFPLMIKPRQALRQQLVQQKITSELHAIRLLAMFVAVPCPSLSAFFLECVSGSVTWRDVVGMCWVRVQSAGWNWGASRRRRVETVPRVRRLRWRW
jgi:Transposase DDE domain